MLDAPGSGLAAPQIGVVLRVFTYHVDGELGHLVNPQLDLSDDEQLGEEGCLSIPGLAYDCRRAMRVVAKGIEPARRAGHDRGQRAARPRDPARDRPPRRRPLRRPPRPRAAQARAEGDPRGRVVRPGGAGGQGQPARHLRPGALGRRAARRRRHPRGRRPHARRARGVAPRRRRRRHPPRRAVRARPPAGAVAGRGLGGRARRPRAAAAPAGRAGVPRRPGRARPGLLPGGRLRRAGAAARRSTSRRTAGSTCTSRCCRPGAARRPCSAR